MQDFIKHWSNEIEHIKLSEYDKNQCSIIRNGFEIAKINLMMSRPGHLYTFEVQEEVDNLNQKLNRTLEDAYSRYRKNSWWYKLLTKIRVPAFNIKL